MIKGTEYANNDKGIFAKAKTVYAESIGFETEDGEEIVLTKDEIRKHGGSFWDIAEELERR